MQYCLTQYYAPPLAQPPLSSTHPLQIKKNLQRTLAGELQELSRQFRKQQKAYLARLRTREASSGALSGGRDDTFDPGFSDLQQLKADTLSTLVDDRDREVQSIVTSIHELAQVMKDLSVLVIEQGTVLDRIDYNMESAVAQVDQGVAQLEKAERKQRQGLAATCIMFLLLAIAILVIFVVIKIIVF